MDRLRRLLLVVLLAVVATPTGAQSPIITSTDSSTAAPLEVPAGLTAEEALRFAAGLTDTQARQLVLQQIEAQRAAEAAAAHNPSGLAVVMVRFRMWLEEQGQLLRERIGAVGDGLVAAPAFVLGVLRGLSPDGGLDGVAVALLHAGLFIGLGMAAYLGIRRLTGGFRRRLEAASDSGLMGRLCRLLLRLLLDLFGLAVLAIVSLQATALVYAGDPVGSAFVSSFVTAVVLIAAVGTVSRFLLAPEAANLRVLAISNEMARFLHRAFLLLAVVSSFVWLTTAFLILTGGPPLGVHLALVLLSGGIVLGLLVALIWQARETVAAALTAAPGNEGSDGPSILPADLRQSLATNWHWFAIGYIGLVATLWAVSMLSRGVSVLWPAVGSIVIVALLPLVDRALQRGARAMIDALVVDRYTPVGIRMGEDGEAPQTASTPPVDSGRYATILLRGARVAMIGLVAVAIMQLWGVDVLQVFGAPGADALWGAAFNIAVIVLVAYVLWQLAETAMTRKQRRPISASVTSWDDEGETPDDAMMGETVTRDDTGAEARARTLLPLIRRFILIVLVVMVVMITLSSIGVDIGPLLAGAGVVGLAIGFGAQALVRDVVSGVFFLIDDAFRIGEYVEMDQLRGEVEAISLRSLRLRHHRGAIHTIPFGELRHLTNYNRDWVIYKMPIRVAAETDPVQVKKIIKRIGAEMQADPELGPKILEPLKSQGVFAIDDDSALIIRVKFMCLPREQFVLRREAYHRIRHAFAEAGIDFARRKVEVMVPPGATPQQIAEAAGAAADERKTPPTGPAATAGDAL